MALPEWDAVVQEEDYQRLSPEDKEKVRGAFFDEYVAPNIEEGYDPVEIRSVFDQETKHADVQHRQKKYDEETGFFGRLGMRLKGGMHDVMASGAGGAIASDTEELSQLAEKEQMFKDFEAGIPFPEDSFAAQMQQENPERFQQWMSEAKAAIPKKRKFIEQTRSQLFKSKQRHEKEGGAIPRAPIAEAVMKAKDWDEAWELIKMAPVSTVGEIGARSLPMMAAPIVMGSIGGALLGPVGFAAGMGGGSTAIERASSLNEGMITKLHDQGVKLTDEKAVFDAISKPEFFEQLKQDANMRSLIIGYLDGVSGGVASKTMAPKAIKSAMAKEIVNVAAQMPVQGALGGLGEAGAQYAVDQELKAGEIISEAIGEFITAPADVLSATLAGVRGNATQKEIKDRIEKDEKLKARLADLESKAEEYRQAREDGATELELEAREEEIMDASNRFMEDADAAWVKYDEEARVIKALEEDIAQSAIEKERKAKEKAIIERDLAEYEGKPAMAPPTPVTDVKKAVGMAVEERKEKTKYLTNAPETQMQKALREADEIKKAAAAVDTKPTEAQKESGNYKKGHVSVQGLPIAIENPKGSIREGKDEGGQEWSQKMGSHYGYIKKSEGADGDHIDVFLGEGAETADKVFVVNQTNPYTGQFDEHKAVIGPKDAKAAEAEYRGNYAEDWTGFDSVVEMSVPEFKAWLKTDTKKPVVQADVAKIDVGPAMAPQGVETDAMAGPRMSKKSKKKTAKKSAKEKKPVRAPRRDLKGKARYRNTAGDLAGAPPGVSTPQKRNTLVKKMVKLLEHEFAQAPESFEWYDVAGKAILRLAKGDKKMAEIMVRLFAFYSQANSLGGNTTAAIKSIYEIARGNMQPMAGRFPNRTKKYIKGIVEAKEFNTSVAGVEDKLMNFYRNLHDSTFGTNLFDEAATQDRWMLRLFGYTEKGDGVSAGKAQYDFAHDLNIDIANAYNKKHGTSLLPREIQAALWFYARNVSDEAKAKSKGQTFTIKPPMNFANYLSRATQVVTWEAIPSVKSGVLPGIHEATEAQRAEYNEAILDLIVDADGNDIILQKLGAVLSRTDQGFGSFELAISPNQITSVVADKVRQEGEKELTYDADIANLYSQIVGIMFTQDAVPWHRADPTLTGKKAQVAYEITADRPITEEMAQQFYDYANTIMPGAEFSMIDGKLRMINFRDKKTGKPFLTTDAKYRANVSTIVDTFTGFDIIDVADFRAEGEFHENDWATNQEGQEYQDQIRQAGRSDLLDWVRGRREAVERINKRFANKYGWDKTPERSIASPVPLSRLTDPQAAQAEIYGRFGTFREDSDTTEDLKIYNLDPLIDDPALVEAMLNEYGYEVKYFSFHEDPEAGVKFVVPKLKKENYSTRTLWIYDPRVAHGSFKDVEYTRQWRIVHELGHGITDGIMQKRYGDSRREGRMGRPWDAVRGHPSKRQVTVELEPLTLKEAQRAVEWEDVAFRVQRMLMEQLGVTVKPDEFGKEYNTNISDAVHRVLTGDFGDPGEYGFVPRETLPPIKDILTMLERTEEDMAKAQGREPTDGIDMKEWRRISQDELQDEIDSQRKRPMLSRTGKGATHVRDLVNHVSQLTNRWKGAPEIRVIADYTHLPIGLKNWVESQNAQDEADGLFDPSTGVVYLIADGISNTDHATKVIFHEVLGHAGIRAVFGNEAVPFLKGVFNANREEMAKVALDYGLDLSKENDQVVAAEEWLAMKAETSPKNTWVLQFISWVRAQLRKLFGGLKVTDAEVLGALGRMRGNIMHGGPLWRQALAIHPMLSRMDKPFYSQMAVVLNDKLPGKGDPMSYIETIEAFVRKGVIKSEEVEWSGVLDWLMDQNQKLSKADVLDYVHANTLEVQEVIKGAVDNEELFRTFFDVFEGEDGGWYARDLVGHIEGTAGEVITKGPGYYGVKGDPVKYGDTEEEAWETLEYDYLDEDYIEGGVRYAEYQLAGGKNYREVLLILADKEIPSAGTEELNIYGATHDYEKGESIRISSTKEHQGVPAGETLKIISKDSVGFPLKEAIEFFQSSGELPSGMLNFSVSRDGYNTSHFDEKNILAHLRINERVDSEGNRVLFIEELQSDWHQQGRRKGYQGKINLRKAQDRYNEIADIPESERTPAEWEEFHVVRDQTLNQGGVPDAPFKTTWPMMAMKRMIRYAAENGFDKVAWTTGEQQAERYDLSKQLDHIKYSVNDNGTFRVIAKDRSYNTVWREDYATEEVVEATLGKDIAEKMVAREGKDISHNKDIFQLAGEDLKIGGEGMIAFYDKMLPSMVNKYIKKWGAKTSVTKLVTIEGLSTNEQWQAAGYEGQPFYTESDIDSDEVVAGNKVTGERKTFQSRKEASAWIESETAKILATPQHSIEITDSMRDSVMKGQPLFHKGKAKAEKRDFVPMEPEDVEKALNTDATAKRILAKDIQPKDGQLVGVRLNINVLKNTGVPIQAIHKSTNKDGYKSNRGFWGGEVINYQEAVTLKNAYFNVHQQARQDIATKQKPKFPSASVDGQYSTAEHSADGIEVRFNPMEVHLFVDMNNRPIKFAEEVTIQGHRAYARGKIEYYTEKTAPKAAGSAESRVVFSDEEAMANPRLSRGVGRVPEGRNPENRPEASDDAINDLTEENNGRFREWAKGVIDKMDRKIDGFSQLIDLESYREHRGKLQALIQQGQDTARHMYETFNKLSEEESVNVFEYLTDRDAGAGIITDPEIRRSAIRTKNMINAMGQMMVERGIIPSASYQNYESRYLPRVYLAYLLGDKAIKTLGTGKKLSKQGYAKKRNEQLTREYREVVLGEIKDPAFLVSRAIGIPSRDLAIMEFFDKILQNPNWVLQDQLVEIDIPGTNVTREVTPWWLANEASRLRAMSSQLGPSEQKTKIDDLAAHYERLKADAMQDLDFDVSEYKQLPDTPQYGVLRGLIVKTAIYDDISESGASLQDNPDAWMKLFGQGGTGTKITKLFKVMKVSLNPPSQVRNLVSNWVLLNLSGVPIHKMIPLLIRALGEIRKGGDYYKIAQEYGITAGTFSANELASIEREFIDLQARQKGKMSIPALLSVASKIIEKAGDIYQHAEVLSKVAKIIHEVESKGNTPALAAQEANKWLFDYSAVNEFIRTARNAPIGIPFLTFYMKVLPRLIEVAATAPWRFVPYFLMLKGMSLLAASMNDVGDEDIEALKKALPKWLQERGHSVIWPEKDEQGRWAATNLGYFFPWTAWTDIAQDVGEVGKGLVTGEPFEARNILQGSGVFGSPLSNLISASMTNIDPFTQKEIVRDGDLPYEQMLSRLSYAYSLMAPPWATPGGPLVKIARAGSGYKDRWGNPQPTLAQSMARVVGVNIYPIDPVRSRKVNLKFMERDLNDIKNRMKYELRDPNLDKEDKQKLREKFKNQLRFKKAQIKKYKASSKVHPNLK